MRSLSIYKAIHGNRKELCEAKSTISQSMHISCPELSRPSFLTCYCTLNVSIYAKATARTCRYASRSYAQDSPPTTPNPF